jgi:hypothetical protein
MACSIAAGIDIIVHCCTGLPKLKEESIEAEINVDEIGGWSGRSLQGAGSWRRRPEPGAGRRAESGRAYDALAAIGDAALLGWYPLFFTCGSEVPLLFAAFDEAVPFGELVPRAIAGIERQAEKEHSRNAERLTTCLEQAEQLDELRDGSRTTWSRRFCSCARRNCCAASLTRSTSGHSL